MDWFRSRIARHPRHATVIGKALFLVGSILVVAAVFARAGLINANAQRTADHLPTLATLAEAYPQYPTWIVPEGPVGFTVAALLVLAGMALIVVAEDRRKGRRG